MSLGPRVKETPFTLFGQSADGKHALKLEQNLAGKTTA